jgi:hypothetical protein
MPIEFHVRPEEALIVARFHGEITVEALRDYNVRLRAHPAFHPGMRELIELDGIRPRLDFRQMAEYRDWFVQLAPLRCSAIVATDAFAYGMARQFATLAGQDSAHMRVFRIEAAARAWLSTQAPGLAP